jgi:hypothetical protein
MYGNKQFTKITKSLFNPAYTSDYFTQNLNLSTNLNLLNFIENSMFWATKRFKFTQSFNTNVQYNEKKQISTIRLESSSKKQNVWDVNNNTLSLMFQAVLNSRYIDNSIAEYYYLPLNKPTRVINKHAMKPVLKYFY